jgi:hypothetical protein
MKWCNNRKAAREKHWINITFPGDVIKVYGRWGRPWEERRQTVDPERKRELQNYPSNGRFYYNIHGWWFEKSDDALYFKLLWA